MRSWRRLLATLLLSCAIETLPAGAAAGEAPVLDVPAPAPPDEPEPPPAPSEIKSEAPPPAAPAPADSADALGFGAPAVAAPPPPPPQAWSVYGTLRGDYGLWTERSYTNPFAKARQGIDLNVRFKKDIFRLQLGGHAEYDFAYLHQSDSYDQPTQDLYAWQLFPREAFAALTLRSFELAAGYQVVPWGHGEILSPLDVAMPRDLREPGLAEPGDLRLPVLSTRLSYFRGEHRVEVMFIHLPAFGLRPPPSGPFSSLPALFSTTEATAAGLSASLLFGRSFDETTPSFNQQFLLRYAYHGPRADIGVYAGTVLDQRGIFIATDSQTFLSSTTLELRHERFGVLGTSGSVPTRWFLFTWEVSADLLRALNTGQFYTGDVDSDRAYLVNTMAGLSFTGVRDLRLSLELLKPWVLNDRDDWLLIPDRPVFAARASYTLLRERLQLSAVASFTGFQLEQGWFLRGEGSFTIRDGLKVNAGYITYQPGSEFGAFYGLDTHDRFYFGLRWDFTIF
jgi:hypothetical protein